MSLQRRGYGVKPHHRCNTNILSFPPPPKKKEREGGRTRKKEIERLSSSCKEKREDVKAK